MGKLIFNNCIPDCPECDGIGWVQTHDSDCICSTCDETSVHFDPRHTMAPCPNKPGLIIDETSSQEVASAKKWGFTA